MSITITQPSPNVEVIFYCQEGNASPYQGRLLYTTEQYDALTDEQLKADQIAQFAAWKANLAALQAEAAAQDQAAADAAVT